MVVFAWFGQACFEIKDSITIVTDPHDGDSVGLNAPKCKGDLITVSHEHYDHASGKDLVSKEDSQILSEKGERTVKGVSVEGFESYHDKVEGDARGENLIFKFKLDGFDICHLGDLGHKLDGDKAERIRPVDILLIPVGGKFTINGDEAAEVTEELEPKVVIPMHFKVEGLDVPISGPEEFLDRIQRDYEAEEMETLELEKLPDQRKVVRLDCRT